MQTRLYIDGEFVDGLAGRTLDVVNPADASVLASVADALRPFPVGCRVELTATAGAPAPPGAASKAASGRPGSPRSSAPLSARKRRQR